MSNTSSIKWSTKHFSELSVEELYAILRLRSEVFVVEQNCVFLDMDNKLTIQNIQKIWGRQMYSKWIPGTYGWAVQSVEGDSDAYYFELASNGRFKHAEIQLRREPKWDDLAGQTVYELWAWNLESNKPEILWRTSEDMKTIRDMCLWLGYMIDKIVPKNKI